MFGLALGWRRSLAWWIAIYALTHLIVSTSARKHRSDEAAPLNRAIILVELPQGAESGDVLREWDTFAHNRKHKKFLEVWVLCRSVDHKDVIRTISYLSTFFISTEETWDVALRRIVMYDTAPKLFGIAAAGTLPSEELSRAVLATQKALKKSPMSPTVVVSRSRIRQRGPETYEGYGEWLSDKFVPQILVNEAALQFESPWAKALMQTKTRDASLLRVITILMGGIRAVDQLGSSPVLVVDGTDFVRAAVTSEATIEWCEGSAAEPVDEARLVCEPRDLNAVSVLNLDTEEASKYHIKNVDFYVSDLSLALTMEEVQSLVVNYSFSKAIWPPPYVLDTVSSEDGLVVVTSVNCGYLDFASNFLASVRKHTDAKIFFVATDEVAFEFMERIVPGQVSMLPVLGSGQRKHSTESGIFGSSAFADQVVIRPGILESILNQGYGVLWTDIDIVWLGNPLPLFPRVGNPSEPDVVLQLSNRNICTCLLYFRCTSVSKLLIREWNNDLVKDNGTVDQFYIRTPLVRLRDSGALKVIVLPNHVMPSGEEYFAQNMRYENETLIVHNNGIKGHAPKKDRWIENNMWYVKDVQFPGCKEEVQE